MVVGRSGGVQGRQVTGCAVSHVRVPAVIRVATGEFLHETIPGHLGEYRSGRDRLGTGIPLYDALVAHLQFRDLRTVNQDELGRILEPVKGPPDRTDGGRPDIVPVDLLDGSGGNGEAPGFLLDRFRKLQPLTGGEEFGIGEPFDRQGIDGKDYCGGDNGARQGAPSRLIYAGNCCTTALPERPFTLEGRYRFNTLSAP